MNLRSGLDKLKFDVRMVELNVRTRTIEQGDVKKHLESLPDLSSNAETFQVDVESGNQDIDSLDQQ